MPEPIFALCWIFQILVLDISLFSQRPFVYTSISNKAQSPDVPDAQTSRSNDWLNGQAFGEVRGEGLTDSLSAELGLCIKKGDLP